MSVEKVLARVELDESVGRIQEAVARGKGLVAALSHFGNWELFALIAPRLVSAPVGAVYQRIKNARVDAHVRSVRECKGVVLLERRKGIGLALGILREKGVVGILADQHAGESGVWVPFFGGLSSTTPLPALLAERTGAVLLPVAAETVGVARWRIKVGAPVNLESETIKTAAETNRVIEQQIVSAPENWFWVHDRWKVPQTHPMLARSRRGVALPKGMEMSDLKPFRLVVRSPNWLGDAVMSIPSVMALTRGRPDVRVSVLTLAKLSDIWEVVPGVEEVIRIEPKMGILRVAKMLRSRGGFDMGVLYTNSLRSALEMALGGVRFLAGYAGHHRQSLLSKVIPELKPKEPPLHHVDRYLRIAERLGAYVEGFYEIPGLMVRPDEDPVPTLVVCPGAEYGGAKRWPAERFIDTAKKVQDEATVRWAIVGTRHEKALGERIAAGIGASAQNLCGETTLRELMDLIARSRAVLTNDTGTMHLATLIGTPVIAIFGSTEPALTGPRGSRHRILRHHVACSPCFLRECPLDFRCMKAISPQEVTATLCEVISGRKPTRYGRV